MFDLPSDDHDDDDVGVGAAEVVVAGSVLASRDAPDEMGGIRGEGS